MISITYKDSLSSEHQKIVIDGLNNNAHKQRELGATNGSFSFVIEDDNGVFQAAIEGFNYYGCFYIDLLFVIEEARNMGHARTLIRKAEDLARERKCLFMAVNTMDFEAKPFYEKYGFEVEFTRHGFEKDSMMYFMKKSL